MRYECSRALKHPWITKDENGVIPLNFYNEFMKNGELYDKFKMAQLMVLGISVLRNKYIEKDRSEILNEYKFQIIREEFLDFTPTPKDKKQYQELDSFRQHFSTDSDNDSKNNIADVFLKPKINIKK